MVQASQQFHSAVYANPANKQMALFDFGDAIFTNEDIDISSGVSMTEEVNPETDLTVGACASSSIEAKILNYDGLLSDFAFGECKVSLGVLIDTTDRDVTSGANCVGWISYGGASEMLITGHSATPYLRVNGSACPLQPSFPVQALAIDGNIVRAIGEDGEVYAIRRVPVTPPGFKVVAGLDGTWSSVATDDWSGIGEYTWDELARGAGTLNAFMVDKLSKWAAQNLGVSRNNQHVHIATVDDGSASVEAYEFASLGVYNIDRPERLKVDHLAIAGNDRMMKFETLAEPFINSVLYPITVKRFLYTLCAYVGVPCNVGSLINGGRILSSAPPLTDEMTCRELLKWVAEATCSFARMNRNGELELSWFANADVTLTEDEYFEFTPAEYTVERIDKLVVKNSQADFGTILGAGTNAYTIVDNGLLYGMEDLEVRAAAIPIYDRLTAFPEIAPCAVEAIADWSIQAGDVIEVAQGDTVYSVPIYSHTLTWLGVATCVYESTGNRSRPPESATNRKEFVQHKARHEVVLSVEELRSSIFDEGGLQSTIEQRAHEIELSVSNNAANVISLINLSQEAVTIQSEKISLEGIVTANNYFRINLDGSMEATNATISGTITAREGKIANWTIGNNALHTDNNALYLGNASISKQINGVDRSVVFSAGSRFGVASDGTLYAANAELSGSFKAGTGFEVSHSGVLTATSGTIGGLTISNDRLSWNNGDDYITADGHGKLGLMSYTPDSATFDGKISAKNIKAGGNDGHITGGSGGQIGGRTIGKYNMGDKSIGKDQIDDADELYNKIFGHTHGIIQYSGTVETSAGSGVIVTTSDRELAWVNMLGIARGGTGATTAAAARANLGVSASDHGHGNILSGGTMSATNVALYTNNQGTIMGGTLGVGMGGTGASNATNARSNLGITLSNLGAAASNHNHSGVYSPVGHTHSYSEVNAAASNHMHGNITNGGAIDGAASGMVLVTGSGGLITTSSIDDLIPGGGSITPIQGSNAGAYIIGYKDGNFYYNTNVHFGASYGNRLAADRFVGDLAATNATIDNLKMRFGSADRDISWAAVTNNAGETIRVLRIVGWG